MCGPAVGIIGNILGTKMQMDAATNQADYQAGIANQNAAIAQAQEMSAGQQGTNEQVQIRNKAAQVTGSQKAAMSANGLDIQAGTPLAILADTAQQSEQDVQTSRYNTAMQMWGLQNQSNQYKAEASNAITAGENASNAALLNGITSTAKMYSDYNSNATTPAKSTSIKYTGDGLAAKDSSGNFLIGNNDFSIKNKSKYKTKSYF